MAYRFPIQSPATETAIMGADIIAIGPTSNQSRGSVVHEYARNRILPKPNTAYLLEIASIDPASQQVSARVEMYEGGLDWPIPI